MYMKKWVHFEFPFFLVLNIFKRNLFEYKYMLKKKKKSHDTHVVLQWKSLYNVVFKSLY